MWVEGGDIQDELFDQLGGVLAPPDDLELTPSAAELEALALAVAARWPEQAFVAGDAPVADPAGDAGDDVVRRLRWAGPRTRRIGSGAWRAGSVAAGIVLFSASAAAAANGGVPLPRPVRVVAYTVGLPVDSPALDDTHQHIKDLKEAVKTNDKPKAEATVRRLQTDLKKVPADEKKEATQKTVAVITEAVNKGVVPPQPAIAPAVVPTTTTTTTAPPAPSTTATTVEEKGKGNGKDDKDKDRPSVTTTTGKTTTTTEPEPTTSTTAPEDDGSTPGSTPGGTTGDPGTGDGHTGAGTGGDPGTTPTTAPPDTTTTTTGPPPEEPTTTTTTAPEPVTTTTTTAPPPPAGP